MINDGKVEGDGTLTIRYYDHDTEIAPLFKAGKAPEGIAA